MKSLHISPELSLPLDAVTQTFAFLARRGAGKTYGASKLCEEMLEAGAQVVVLDPVGNWYGLRLAADGKGKGFDIPVFGGLHGDIPLEPGAGALVADLVADKGISVILDVSMFRKGDRKQFATVFAEQLFQRKKEKRSPIHIFIEEAQVFVPQRTGPDEARMLGAFEDLVKLGRNFGIGVTLISQRPQAVNKDALNQTEALFVLQTNGSQERKALRDWIVDQGLDVGKLVDDLPGLQKGVAYVWSPSWLQITQKVHIGKKKTFNASATPEMGEKAITRELAPVDLQKIQEAMKEVVARAADHDPKALRRRIAELNAELQRSNSATQSAVPDEKALERARAQGRREVERDLAAVMSVLREARGRLQKIQNLAAMEIQAEPSRAATLKPPTEHPTAAPAAPILAGESSNGTLNPGESKILRAVAQYSGGVTKEQLTVLTGYKRSSRDTYLQRLSKQDYLRTVGDRIAVTANGIALLGPDFQKLPQGEALQKYWLHRLTGGERAILETVIRNPEGMSRDGISEATGYKRSSRDTYLQRLASRQIIRMENNLITLSEEMI